MFLNTLMHGAAVTSCLEARGTPPILQGNNWPKPLEYIRKGNNRTFSCVATGSATLKYEWRFNGEKLNASEKEARFDANTGSLFIGEYFNEQLTGDYQCVVSNEFGTAMTPYFRIAATVANPFPNGDNMFPDDIIVYRSNYLKMDCINVPKSVPAWTFNWQRGMDPYTLSDAKPVNVSERMIIDPNGSLHFLWVEMSDDGYVYVCEAKNKITLTEVRNKHTTQLHVFANKRDRLPELKYSSDVTVSAGETAELTCIFTYYSSRGEKLDITWTFNNKEVGHGSTLRLPNIKVPDKDQNSEGEYVCEAKLGLLQPVRGKVNLKITGKNAGYIPVHDVGAGGTTLSDAASPPVFLRNKAPALTSIPVGQDAVFLCGATSHKSYMKPPVWMVNSKPLIGCFPNYFDCGAGRDGYSICIPDKQVCDSIPDCSNQRDEQNCETCGEGTKLCKGSCIPVASECVKPTCTYPGFLCYNQSCLQGNQVCDGKTNCGDWSDELGCPGGPEIQRGRFRLNSERTEVTLQNVMMQDVMCFQCLVQNEYGVLFGDGCLTLFGKIELTIAPNDTYYTHPGSVINVGVDAITDVDWMDQMAFKWYWYRPKIVESGPNEGQEIIVREMLPPLDIFRDSFFVSLTGKNLTITIPKVDREASVKTQYDLYNVLTSDRIFQVVVAHQYDTVERNFTVIGEKVEPPNKIELTIAPNDTYYTRPGSVINVGVDAITDVDWMNQMAFKWYWYRPKIVEIGPNEGQEIIVREMLPPSDMFRDYFFVSLTGKNLTITIPKVDREASIKTQYDLYNVLTSDRIFQVVVAHQYDTVECNFTVIGEKVEPPMPVPVEKPAGFNQWFIALIAGIPVLLIVVALIICFIHRNRGGTSTLHKNENKADNNPEQELKENDFHDDLNDASRDVETGLNAEARPLSTGIEEADIGKGSEVMEDGSDNIETRPLSCVSEDADCGKGSEFVEDGSDNIETRPLSCGREDADCAKGSEFVEDGLGNIEERPLSFGRGDADFGKKSEVKEEGSLIG